MIMYHFVKCTLPSFFIYLFGCHKIIKNLKMNGISNIRKFSWKSWHFGYRYFVGVFNNNKVFVKYNNKKNWISFESDNFKKVENSENLSLFFPKFIFYRECGKGAYLVEEYVVGNSILAVKGKDYKIIDKIMEQLLLLTIELHKNNFKHLDINVNNVYICEDGSLKIIDLGFSNLNKNKLEWIGNKRSISRVVTNLNKDTRLDVGLIDDAFSILSVAKVIDPNLISNRYDTWKKMNNNCGILYADLGVSC